ncbi:four helix bundle protein [Candidatus Saccharibacteria bacterium]|nr:four helix bundle protein [Candidatus Saccharibacteria bacterium]
MKILAGYKKWHTLSRHVPKIHRYSLGVKIDDCFAGLVELVAMAQFSDVELRRKYLTAAIAKNDCLKFMLYTLYEIEGIDEKSFVALSSDIEEVGKMLYGWKNKIETTIKS